MEIPQYPDDISAETELRDARAALAAAEARVTELEIELHQSDVMRTAVVTSAADAAQTTTKALELAGNYREIVDAAVLWFDAQISSGRERSTATSRLTELVSAEVKRRKVRS